MVQEAKYHIRRRPHSQEFSKKSPQLPGRGFVSIIISYKPTTLSPTGGLEDAKEGLHRTLLLGSNSKPFPRKPRKLDLKKRVMGVV